MSGSFVFVHGWATDGSVWDGVAWDVARGGEAAIVNLPGHGNTRRWETPDLAPAVREVEEAIAGAPDGSVVGVGWSLGALSLLALDADKLKRFRALVLTGATPCFVATDDFTHGQPRALVKRMIMDMKSDPASALDRFYGLNFTSDEAGAQEARDFIVRYRYPGPVECTSGGRDTPPGCYPLFNYRDITTALEALYHTDLRAALASIDLPVLIIHGEMDTVAPAGAGEYLARNMPKARFMEFKGAGHAPFLTEPERFSGAVKGFLADL